MKPDDVDTLLESPSAPLGQLHEQSLKNRDHALAVLNDLPDAEAQPLPEELAQLINELETAYQVGDAVEHYRLDRQLFFQFMMKLSFTAQAAQGRK